MVGNPKHLSDLARIEADVRITCRVCGFEQDWRREELARHLRAIGGSQVWSELTRHLRCMRFGCGAAELSALAVPYSRRQANMPRRIGRLDARIVETAVAVLEHAVGRSRGGTAAGIDVRLALLVLHRYVRDRALVVRFWERASDAGRTVDRSLAEPLAAIRHRLVSLGWLPPAVLLDPPRFWPWNSPPPPGWVGPPAAPHAPGDEPE